MAGIPVSLTDTEKVTALAAKAAVVAEYGRPVFRDGFYLTLAVHGKTAVEIVAVVEQWVGRFPTAYDADLYNHGDEDNVVAAALGVHTLIEPNSEPFFGLPPTHNVDEIRRRASLDIPCSWAGTFAAPPYLPRPEAIPPGVDADVWTYVTRLHLEGQFPSGNLVGMTFRRFCFELGAIPFSEV